MKIYTDGTSCNFGFPIIIQFVDDNGTPIDISAATSRQLVFVTPDKASISKPASFVTTGEDGRIQYIVERSLFLKSGTWRFYGIAGATSSFNKDTSDNIIDVIRRKII